ncbi:hypothetical protein BT63DRAFT_292002 [Microthyrium microscopicum]|uniref:Uncharacterized protein n=1 Tax=Microthyrium microscopicum TaxID=703497 RepID=A0A6A6U8J9_9PEZI|nr:hypothetical protein BT63DRAFT_292002 [Microthyrium microscopicum]
MAVLCARLFVGKSAAHSYELRFPQPDWDLWPDPFQLYSVRIRSTLPTISYDWLGAADDSTFLREFECCTTDSHRRNKLALPRCNACCFLTMRQTKQLPSDLVMPTVWIEMFRGLNSLEYLARVRCSKERSFQVSNCPVKTLPGQMCGESLLKLQECGTTDRMLKTNNHFRSWLSRYGMLIQPLGSQKVIYEKKIL